MMGVIAFMHEVDEVRVEESLLAPSKISLQDASFTFHIGGIASTNYAIFHWVEFKELLATHNDPGSCVVRALV